MIFANFTNDDVEKAIAIEGRRYEVMAEICVMINKFAEMGEEEPEELLDELRDALVHNKRPKDVDDDREKIIKALVRYMDNAKD